jgi:hypothetical protein
MKMVLFSIAAMLVVSVSHAAEPTCKTQAIGNHGAKLCVAGGSFQHDYYTLWVDGAQIFTLPDDYVEKISLTHTIPADAAIEFALSKQGTPQVTIVGGCVPESETQTTSSGSTAVETGRICSFTWGNEVIVKDLHFSFD